MKLADWLNLPNADGSKRKRIHLAAAVGVTPSMITEYCSGRMWPRREIMENIIRHTEGAVTANDFLDLEVSQ